MEARYVIIGDILYKRSIDDTLLRCLIEKETSKAIEQVHDNISG